MENVTLIRIIAGILAVIVCPLFYFLPTIIARRKRNVGAIFLLNLVAGWTFIGWIDALILAIAKEAAPVVVVQQSATEPATLSPNGGKYSGQSGQFCSRCGHPQYAVAKR